MRNRNKHVKYIFLRHGKLDLPYKNHSEMPLSILIQIASGKINPSIDINFFNNKLLKIEPFIKNAGIIIASPFKRCIETSHIISEFLEQKTKNRIEFFIENDLREVFFDIEKIISDINYNPNLQQLNGLVFQAICGLKKGAEESQSVFDRINKVLKKYDNNKVILVITHSFLLEILEMYINNKNVKNFSGSYEELLKSPKIDYLSGFTTDNELNIIDFISIK